MFKKLLSNLPFNPSLINQVSFYSKRLHKEEGLRRAGVVLVVLAVMIQMFAVISPPEPTLAESDNDIIRGGFSTHQQAINHCNDNTQGFKSILSYYGIDCKRLARATTTSIRSTDFNKKLHSMGRNAQGQYVARTGKPTNEYPVSIPKAGTFFMRNLWAWDSGAYSTYKVLTMKNAHGQTIMILYDCANIVTIDKYVPPPPPPPPTPEKVVVCSNLIMSVSNNARVKTGTVIELRGQASGRNLEPGELSDMYYEMLDSNNNRVGSRQEARGLPFNNGVAQDSVARKFKLTEPGAYKFRLAVQYHNKGSKKNATGNQTGNCLKQVSVENEDVCPEIPGDQTSDDECISCPEARESNDKTACLEFMKTASNETQNIENADGTTADGGDVIRYRLSVTNTGLMTVPDFAIVENISDILQYADVQDLDGGELGDDNTVRWPAEPILPGKTIERTLIVQIKNPVPQTPVSASDPSSFDLVMNNVFHDKAVNIKLPPTVTKTTEQVVTTLPNTGPGTNIAITVGVTVFASYFFARARLMAKEIEIVRSDYATSGS